MPAAPHHHRTLPRPLPVRLAAWVVAGLLACAGGLPNAALAMGLAWTHQARACSAPPPSPGPSLSPPMPAQAAARVADSQIAAGQQDVAWVWLGSPTLRYPHRALGSPVHAGSVHALVRSRSGGWQLVEHSLPLSRVYEDRKPRIVDIDRDGSEEIVLIEADAIRGASLVVLGLDHRAGAPRLVERARSAFAGTPFRWLNPVGVADFDGDGQQDLAVVYTPHIGGQLQLLHFRPPSLEPFARTLDVSNHRMGAIEQELAVIVQTAGHRPTIIVPDMSLRALHALRWEAPGQWAELSEVKPLPGRIERVSPAPGGACVTLDDGRALHVMLAP